MAIIQHRDARFDGVVDGVEFAAGKAEVDDGTVAAFSLKGYHAVGMDPRVLGDGVVRIGTPLQDAAEAQS